MGWRWERGVLWNLGVKIQASQERSLCGILFQSLGWTGKLHDTTTDSARNVTKWCAHQVKSNPAAVVHVHYLDRLPSGRCLSIFRRAQKYLDHRLGDKRIAFQQPPRGHNIQLLARSTTCQAKIWKDKICLRSLLAVGQAFGWRWGYLINIRAESCVARGCELSTHVLSVLLSFLLKIDKSSTALIENSKTMFNTMRCCSLFIVLPIQRSADSK